MKTSPMDVPVRLIGEELVLRHGKSIVVDDASITLEAGRVTALVGPNGSGKSTLLRALARLHDIDAGQVLLDTGDGAGPRSVSLVDGREFAREVTLFTQSRQSPEGLSVGEIVAFGRHPYRRVFGGLSPADRRAIDDAMRVTGVHRVADRAAGELSGGELQRVWLATCLAQETGVLLLDEPTNHLDLRYQIETLDLVRDLVDQRGVAVGIVLHDLHHAALIADTLILLQRGRVRAVGPPSEVLTDENLGEVYEIRVETSIDPESGRLRIDPVSRHRGPAVRTT
ncbi:ABC transporter ATP-binding protein [Rhodococcus yananensis]|uniref:ABC transporter ATP-binding protein n=1 Tax=Rhodococcus yananensis TaxID=2879464 RepID=UPI003EBFA4F0